MGGWGRRITNSRDQPGLHSKTLFQNRKEGGIKKITQVGIKFDAYIKLY
jgi:hypothetical protein